MANSNIQPYPFMFDPSQFANKYSSYAGQALPFMGLYAGGATGPTDAHGNPIQSYQDALAAHNAWSAANPPPAAAPVTGTTLNTNPIHGVGGLQPGQYDAANGLPAGQPMDIPHATTPQGMPYGQTSLGQGVTGSSWQPQQGMPQGPAKPAAPAAAPTNPIDMNAAYLSALANPGKVTTPGATVPQSAPPSASSGVLQQFLQNWKPGANPAGSYNPNLFPDALRGTV